MITTLLDNDFYQLTMAQVLWRAGFHEWQVRYEFRNRTFAVPLASRIDLDVLAKNIEKIRELTFKPDEIEYLRTLGLFNPTFLEWLPTVRLPEVNVSSLNSHLVMTYDGNWGEGIFWETPLLALVNDMYYERFQSLSPSVEGVTRLMEKITYLQERQTIKFVEFGTRRRFSADWQHYVTHRLKDEIPELLLGTSNVQLAKDLRLKPVGTMAHQLFMVLTAHYAALSKTIDPISAGANRVLEEWEAVYRHHPGMMTVLPDTYTTRTFLDRVPKQALKDFTTFRQDSGDPIAVGKQLAVAALGMGIPPKIIFSDSLDVRRMSVIEDNLPDVEMTFGWGTNLTNDLGYEPLSIVIKPCAMRVSTADRWVPCVKISDDIAKATGDPVEIRRYVDSYWGVISR